MIGRDLKSLYHAAGRAAAASASSSSSACAPRPIPDRSGQPRRPAAARSWALPAWSAPAAPSWPAPSSASTAARRRDRARRRAGRDRARRAMRSTRGIYLVPEDRKRSGLLLDLSIAREHLAARPAAPTRAACIVTPSARPPTPSSSATRLDIKAPSVATAVGALSGGNQQKVVLAKWLSMQPARDDLRRADARHRRRRQERDLRADARARRPGRRRS